MTEILASSIVAVSGDLGGNTDVSYRTLDGEYWEKRFSPGKTFHVVAQTVDPPTDVADAVEQLIRACTDPDPSMTANIPVEAARRRLYTLLDRHGVDGTGWMPDPPTREELRVVTEERDAALLEIERLNGVIYDAHERMAYEQKRADDAEAAVREWELEADTRWRYAGGIGGMEPDGSAERVDEERERWLA